MDGDKTVTAHFVPLATTYELTMAVEPVASGTTDPAVGVHTYPEDEVVAVTANAGVGYEFDHWTGDVADPNAASTTVTMDGDKTVTAHFVPVGQPVCVTIQRGTLGEVADGYIASGYPTQGSFSSYSFYTGLSGTGENRALIRFDLDELPAGAVVHTATLGLSQYTPASGETVHIYRMTQGWSEGEPTWATFSGSYDAYSWASFESVGGSITADVTDLAAVWVSGAQPNYGMMLINSPAQTSDRYLSSEYSDVGMRPWLEVCYTAP